MSNLNDLRDEYRRRRDAVTAKIGRTRRQTGAEVAGTKFDPRPARGAEKRMNRATLNKRIAEFNEFTNRNLQFVSGDSGAPIRRHRFNLYKRTEQGGNEVGRIHDEQMNSIRLPHRGEGDMTIADARRQLNQGQGAAVYGPYKTFNRDSRNFTSEEAMEEARVSILNSMTEKFLPTKLGQGKKNLSKVLEIMNEHDMVKRVNALSDYQFDVLWYGDPATIERLFVRYDVEQDKAVDRKKAWHEDAAEGATDDFGQFLGWVESDIPVERPATAQDIPSNLTARPKPKRSPRRPR